MVHAPPEGVGVRHWPRAVTLVFGIIPVIMLGYIVVTLGVRSTEAVSGARL